MRSTICCVCLLLGCMVSCEKQEPEPEAVKAGGALSGEIRRQNHRAEAVKQREAEKQPTKKAAGQEEVVPVAPDMKLTAAEIKQYIRFISDRRLSQLGLQPIYRIEKNPLPWLDDLLNGMEHTNFFENRSTEYSRAATQGSWDEVWGS